MLKSYDLLYRTDPQGQTVKSITIEKKTLSFERVLGIFKYLYEHSGHFFR